MRILHTSDWHLGRTLHGVDLHDHQQAFVDHLVGLVADRSIDVVVVAGDVYDRAVPAVPSVRLLGRALARLTEHATVIVTPGNHDSAVRLGFAAELMRPGLHLRASVDLLDEPVVVDDPDGPVAFYGLPYLDPDSVRRSLATAGVDEPLARSHAAVMGAAMQRVRADLARRPGTRSVVVAHAFVVAGPAADREAEAAVGGGGVDVEVGTAPERSESERDIRVGGVDSVPSTVFDGVDYVALGHLHGAQRVGPSGRLRYSGSPLAFSFGERNQVKSSTIVELAADGSVSVDLVPAPVPRRLAEVTDTLDALLDGRHDDLRDAWLRVFVTDPVHPERLYTRVAEHFPHALAIHHTPVGAVEAPALAAVTSESDPIEVAADFVAFASGGAASETELAVVRGAYEAARASEASE
ncbi:MULTISPECIES: exonuclease SbcCD subunit D C-terminal domain-containing protein [unclassified Frigoribacterium]|uniref:metallophosphoesterase family protein n=1 Tax=unclassified Frigoribacterium TaxID=2627005 RepID=UPI0006FD0988|nr:MULTISPECIES: exonuclease SbcCD subunit D C-terminal domain-containing protein [unclassified Frigoribacterium]KQO45372.1 DNA exonuclease SbcCD subunit SbcD [Frigoribacterium sp. Leaf254]KQT37074.1 DNA exonuclease SbcCD subunit SbcD [Frigoribacterium sp. Leaf415]